MTRLDDDLREALGRDAEAEDTLTGLLLDSFRGRTQRVTLFAWMKMTGTLGIAVLSAVCFFASGSTRAQIAWAAAFVAGFVGFAMWWIWYWMYLNRASELREIKRLELQIAELRSQLG